MASDSIACASCLVDFQPTDDTIKCVNSDCNKRYHMGICIGGTVLAPNEINCWTCPLCRCAAKRGGDNSSTPVRLQSHQLPTTPEANITFRTKPKLPSSDLQALTSEIRGLREEVSTFKVKLDNMSASMNVFSLQFEQLFERLATSDERLKLMEERYDSDMCSFRAHIADLENKINIQDQMNLRNEIEIIGIPENQNENLHHLVLVAASKLGVEVKDVDIDWIQRVGPKKPPAVVSKPDSMSSLGRPIVMRLIRKSKRDDFLKVAKSRRSLTTVDLGIEDQQSKRVYFNERLTRQNRQLFRECRNKSSLAGYRYCWINNGSIYIRRKEGSPTIKIRNSLDLDEKLISRT